MNQNYHKLCMEEINKLTEKKKLLLHSCCGPCSSYVISFLAEYFNITILYYNPNISPYEEYKKRKEEQIKLIDALSQTLKNKISFLDCDYENEKYNEVIKGFEECKEGGNRCKLCFNLRLEKTAILTKKNNFDYFASTLTVSPHKNANIINEIGKNIADKYNVKWLYSDFKKNEGYKKSIELSKKYNLYRQNYCGCTFSKKHNEKQEQFN